MNSLIEDEEQATLSGQRDREITLGTTTILGIFFALAVLCAGFFGFGYSLGSKHNVATESAAEPVSGVPRTIFNSFKPAAGKQPATTEKVSVPLTSEPEPRQASAAVKPAGPPTNPATKPFVESANTETAASRRAPATGDPAGTAVNATSTDVASKDFAQAGAAQSVVQIAAVTHQEDADLIASTLKRRGYSVNIRQEPQDKLLHVQVGPFASKKDAEAMRQRLLADGFNAYVK